MNINYWISFLFVLIEIILLGLPFCFYKFWNKNFVITLILSYFIMSSMANLTYKHPIATILMDILGITVEYFFILNILYRQRNLQLLKEVSFICVSVFCILLGIVSSFFGKNMPAEIEENGFKLLWTIKTVAIYVIAEELIADEIVFKLIKREKSYRIFFVYLGISIFITLCHIPMQENLWQII